MLRRKGILKLLVALIAGLSLSGMAWAGPGTVEVTTVGDITLKMGAMVRVIPTAEIDRDFGISDRAGNTVAFREHLTEGAGAVKDSYIRNENRLFFNFAHGQDWDVYMALEMDSLWDRSVVDRTDFARGAASQQFGIERLMATYNLPALNSRLEAGWDARGVDIGSGNMVYGDDDAGFGIVGGAEGYKWEVRYIKKDENEAGYMDLSALGLDTENPLGTPVNGKDADRTFIYGKIGKVIGDAYIEGFYHYDKNHIANNIDHQFVGFSYSGNYGKIKPVVEAVYSFGDYEVSGGSDMDIDSWAVYADIALDMSDQVGRKCELHVGGYYLTGDDNPNDNDLEGYAPSVGTSRFNKRFGTEQSISMDGNPIFGQVLYSVFPTYLGTSNGAGINGKADLDNPGFIMIGGGVKTAFGKMGYKGNVMAMWFDETKAVENALGLADVDDFMGIEWNNELSYPVFKNVTVKGGFAFLFPGSGAKDITRKYDSQGRSSDNVSMRFASELIWFF